MTPNDIQTQIANILHSIMPAYSVDYWQNDAELFGAIPEFDSMTIVALIGELEDYFDIEINDDDISAEHFATVESLVTLVAEK